MAEHNDLGKWGEDCAADFLRKKGYTILHRNWRNRFEEIDIIAEYQGQLIIVEVKTRSGSLFGKPESFITLTKQRLLVNAADVYIQTNQVDLETRFDVVSVVKNGEMAEIEHIERAFSPFD